MAGRDLPNDELVTMLRDAPSRIAAAAKGLSEEQLHAPPSAGEWSVTEVLGHMRACADCWGDCIAVMIAEDRPTIRAINPRSWIKRTEYPEQQFRSSLRAYTKQRAELVALLASLAPNDWSRTADITGAGKPLVRTVRDYMRWLALHERPHLKQIADTAGAVRRAEPRHAGTR
jgi:uncharacterized damage-inducible protein DinB